MDWYSIFKFLHVVSAIVWLGGVMIMIIFGIAADRARDEKDLVGIVLKVAWAAERVFIPASIATLIFGIIATTINGLWDQLWVHLGFVGIVSTIALGVLVLTPRAKRVKADYDARGVTPTAVAVSYEILTIAKFDIAVLFTIVADMVLKPSLSDWVTLLVMALVIVGAAAIWVLPVLRKPAVT
jgi:uncharacterized membrane protein